VKDYHFDRNSLKKSPQIVLGWLILFLGVNQANSLLRTQKKWRNLLCFDEPRLIVSNISTFDITKEALPDFLLQIQQGKFNCPTYKEVSAGLMN
jgi:hypothetical protein